MAWQITLDQENSVLSGEEITGTDSGVLVKAPGCQIVNCNIHDLTGIGVGIVDGGSLEMIGGLVANCGRQGIAFTGSSSDYGNSRIAGVQISNPAGYDCIQVCGSRISIEDCTLSNSMFAGVYCATGSRNISLSRNTVSNCYCGFDISWGTLLGGGTGDITDGIIASRNIIYQCVSGIGVASNGTVLTDNSITNSGYGASQTFTLLNVPITIASPGSGYSVGDIMNLTGGTGIRSQVKVSAVDQNGAITSATIGYLGCYTVPPANPIQVTGGSGQGAVLSIAQWNARGNWGEGIVIVNAQNCVVANNVSTSGQVGCAFVGAPTMPKNCVVVNNKLSGNAQYAFKGRYANRYQDNIGTGHIVQGNT